MRLTVKQLKNRDPGSGMAVIDREALQGIGVSSGDFVAIEVSPCSWLRWTDH